MWWRDVKKPSEGLGQGTLQCIPQYIRKGAKISKGWEREKKKKKVTKDKIADVHTQSN